MLQEYVIISDRKGGIAMKRISVFLLVLVLLVGSLTGCNGADDNYNPEQLIDCMNDVMDLKLVTMDKYGLDELLGKYNAKEKTKGEYEIRFDNQPYYFELYISKSSVFDSVKGYVRVIDGSKLDRSNILKDAVSELIKQKYPDANEDSQRAKELLIDECYTWTNETTEYSIEIDYFLDNIVLRGPTKSTQSSSGRRTEDKSDGHVGDNNGDGKVDNKYWEQEWGAYLDKKYKEAGV